MSLQRIALKDFVIVDHLALELGAGFTALTGETGAGKSILIDALQLALGGRADPSAIRDGQSKAEVVVEFAPSAPCIEWLNAAGIDADGSALLIRRTVDTQGRSRGWINGTPVTALQLRELGGLLVDIHGQHAWQGLMKPETNRELLDAYAGIDTQPLQRAWADWQAALKCLTETQQAIITNEAERERLTLQLAECDKLAPQPEEWPDLQEEHSRLANAAALGESAQAALNRLCEAEVNVLGLLTRAQQALAPRTHQDTRFEAIGETLAQAMLLAQEATRDLQAYARHCEPDPNRLAELEHRLGHWMSLAKRHRCTPEELPQLRVALQQRLDTLTLATDLKTCHENVTRHEVAYTKISKQISNKRLEFKEEFAIKITSIIQQLGMTGGRLEVHMTPLDRPQATGVDFVEFRVAGHTGAAAKPVMKVASGGELSRLALAISVTTSQLGGCPTLIFDEVDSGIGGTVAHTVGHLMRTLGQQRQVLAVTHLAQVACCAHHHVQVSKQWVQGHLQSRAEHLDRDERVTEVARMLGANGLSQTPLAHAREMLGYD